MPLKLDEFIEADDFIEYGNQKMIVTANVPRDFYEKFSKIVTDSATMDQDKITQKSVDKMLENARTITIDLLSIKNDKKVAKKFVKDLPVQLFVKTFHFLGEFLANSISKKKID